ncbi:hypothetical protein ANN_13705 [Periplaneta americana]|uniref:DUF659 domain-containing protein n=1 Tax=Periplaneta americana TaxID=6978 RepID=A0ABQ8SVU6_PERAM|nr:hypothetical protein ANN_13705 [Periplaneta americana]
MYATPVRNVRDLRERIIEAIESIPEDMLQGAWQEIVHRLDIVTVTAGAHSQMLAGSKFQSLGRVIVKEDEYEEVRWDCFMTRPCVWIMVGRKDTGGVVVGGRTIKCVRFADGMALLIEEEMVLRDMLLELNDSCEQYEMKINANKTKTMVIGRKIKKVNLRILNEAVEQSLMLASSEFQSLGRAIVKEDEYEDTLLSPIKETVRMVTGRATWFTREQLVENKVFREFLEKYTQHTIPDESTLRKTYAPSIYDETIQKIRDEIKDSSIWVSIDETPDKEGRLVEKCNNKTIVKLFNEAMGILWPKGIMYDNVLFFISDAAPYMVKAGQALSVVYPKLTHFTCVAHAFHRVAEVVRDNFLK